MKALFIGRFQPFHKGHLSVVEQAVKENTHLYIGIGSTQYNYEPYNPLTTSERIQLIEAALKEAKIPREKYSIIPVPNIENFALWPRHVELYIPPFQKLYTGSSIVAELFHDYNKTLKKPYEIIPVQKTYKICSTEIRTAMLKNKPWEKHVAQATAKLLNEWQIPKRLKTIAE
ncbi:nicotinamide-nucleotide adenylyltransferase [Candidatus Peregrinibacteria bacterium]|nr:nicotinamide-nucleotide adenylyltransferase [Candidatus Peregrinibacteria bacterium]